MNIFYIHSFVAIQNPVNKELIICAPKLMNLHSLKLVIYAFELLNLCLQSNISQYDNTYLCR